MKTELTDLFQQVKSDFCNLMDYKLRGNTLEIITGVSTLTNHYVSVFVSLQSGTYIISDGGWIDKGFYDNIISSEDEDVFQRVETQFQAHFDIRQTKHRDGTRYYFKAVENPELISVMVRDVSQYVSAIVNSQAIAFNEAKETSQRATFYQDVNTYLREHYGSDILELNGSLKRHGEELAAIRFNAIIRRPTTTHLVMYVTGYTAPLFVKDACEATVNFQIAKKDIRVSRSGIFQRSAIVNTMANGFVPVKVNEYLANLEKELEHPLISYHSDKSKILEQIPERVAA
ncbi:hypothetical protein BN8_02853 [Fibrisoma limi BUZ 3]|uniref:DUF1828 domain-containing protein n=2 Tax=Fibrisoma limi TaxID=663275 RepID=I2GIL0_9BACT|nr:hypothetical protein BN8_02853 [Fibrisoma limi BUZ 3]